MGKLGDLLSVARTQIGTTETPPGSNHTKYGVWYGMDGVAWCAEFVSWCADQVGLIKAGVIPKHAYTPSGAAWFQSRGQWGTTPKVGALAYYNISGLGRISHVGIVESVNPDGSFLAIEGNTNGAGSRVGGEVWRQKRRNMGPGGGFGYPKYPVAPEPAAAARPAGPAYPGSVLKRGSKGDAVRTMQARLNLHLVNGYGKGISTDGDFGPATEAAVRWYQECRHGAPFNLSVDGVVGPATWVSLWR
jgi:hypothetical protein